MIDTRRRAFLATLLATPLLMKRWVVGTAVAQDAASRVLWLLVPAAPGGSWDGSAQVIAKVLRETGAAAEVQIEYVPGAGGALALPRFVVGMRGRPNTLMVGGLTLLSSPIVNESALTVFDTTPIARLEAEPLVLTVAADSPLQTIEDFARALRADAPGLRVAGGSEGSADQILLAMIGQALSVDVYGLSYLPFSGGGPASQAVLDGSARAGISNWSEFAPYIESGRMRALALSGDARHLGVEVPTLREGGIDVVLYNWNGVFAPPGIDEEARADLEALVDAMVRSAPWQSETTQRRWQGPGRSRWQSSSRSSHDEGAAVLRWKACRSQARGDGEAIDHGDRIVAEALKPRFLPAVVRPTIVQLFNRHPPPATRGDAGRTGPGAAPVRRSEKDDLAVRAHPSCSPTSLQNPRRSSRTTE